MAKKKPKGQQLPVVFETFQAPIPYMVMQLEKPQPSCFNGSVCVVKYRITIEKVEEPDEAVAARLVKLWLDSDNSHHMEPLSRVGKEFGVDLHQHKFGANRRKHA